MNMLKFGASSIAGVSIALLLAPAAAAQTAAKAEPVDQANAAESNALLEDIVVTARKRSESLQSTPVAVTAFGESQVKAVFAQHFEDLGRLSPGVRLQPAAMSGVQNFTIRGMGANSSTPSEEPAVGIIQDGVYLGVNYGANLDLFNIESVQILRGPQGTLFGRNVTGGAILVRTARPTGEFHAGAQVTIGNYGQNEVQGFVDVPLEENRLAVRLSAATNYNGGFYNNLANGSDYGKSRGVQFHGALRANPTDRLEFTIIGDHYLQYGDAGAAVGLDQPGSIPYNLGYRRPAKFFDINSDVPGTSRIEANSAILETTWEALGGEFTSITGYRDVNADINTDSDGTPFTLFHQAIRYRQNQFSQELRFTTNFSSLIDFTAGLYYFNQKFNYHEGRDINLHATVVGTKNWLRNRSAAVFAEVDVHILPRLTLTVGGRGQYERKVANTVAFAPIATICPGRPIDNLTGCNFAFGPAGRKSWQDFSPKAGLKFEIDSDNMLYGSFTRGYRSGGFSLRGNTLFAPYQPESVNAYEIGYKGDLFDRRLRVGLALYQNDYSDIQRTVIGTDPVFGLVQSTFNVADARIRGIEADFTAEITDRLVLTGNYAYTQPRFRNPQGNFNASLRFVRVPEHTGGISATYTLPVGDLGSLSFRGSGNYTSSQFFDDANTLSQDPYWIVDASATFTDASQRWTAAIFSKNLTNTHYYNIGAQLGALGRDGFLGVPRTVGLRLTYKY